MEDINESIKSDQELDELSPGLSEGMCVRPSYGSCSQPNQQLIDQGR